MTLMSAPNPSMPTAPTEETRGLRFLVPNVALIKVGGICGPCGSGRPDSECLNHADYGLLCEENLR
jgi:hypothetical protein